MTKLNDFRTAMYPLKELILSEVYPDQVAYGIAYDEHNGKVELIDSTFTNPYYAINHMNWLMENDPDHTPMRVVVLRVEPL